MDERLPHDFEAERSVVGSILMDKDSIYPVSELLVPEDFLKPKYRKIYGAMLELYTDGQPVDLITVKAKLESQGAPGELYSIESLKELLDLQITTANVKAYAELVKDKSQKRSMIQMLEANLKSCYDEKINAFEIIETTEKELYKMTQTVSSCDAKPIRKIVVDAVNEIHKATMASGTITGVATGFYGLDRLTSGFQPSNLILIAGRPAMGKTAFALNIAEYVGMKHDTSVVIFSLEMSGVELAKRLISMNAKVDSQHMRNGNLDDVEMTSIAESSSLLGESSVIIDDTSALTVQDLRSRCKKYKRENNLGLIIIDYLQLMNGVKSRKNDSRQNEISEISRNLKILARELNCPVVALSQLSREVEKRNDKRPMLSDLRESGAIEQDADVVMFLYREEVYNKKTEKKGIAEIIVGKQRSGPTGTVELKWLPQYTKFMNVEK